MKKFTFQITLVESVYTTITEEIEAETEEAARNIIDNKNDNDAFDFQGVDQEPEYVETLIELLEVK